MISVHSTLERVVRESYGRLLAFLAARTGDWPAAEDAIGEAFRSALERWPATGVPENPEAWLLVVARRRLSDTSRQAHRYADVDLSQFDDGGDFDSFGETSLPDERLKMLFLCTHPAIDNALHTPLMLQAVLGLTAERIASAFLVRPSTMGQRLSRAKAKMKQARIRFELPDRRHLLSRLNAVLEAIYAAYGIGWDNLQGSDARLRSMADEAIFLGRLLADLLPDEAEVHGLLALMLYSEARKAARRSESGSYVPLAEQSVDLWSKDLLCEAERHLTHAGALGCAGRFQLEAAIQSVHVSRRVTGYTDWEAIVVLYRVLLRLAPTVGVRLGYAAAMGQARGAEEGVKLLVTFTAEELTTCQSYWALIAHFQTRLGRTAEARRAYEQAAGLCEDAAVRRFLLEKLSRL